MSDRIFLETDVDGTDEYCLFDAEGNLLAIQRVNDVEPVIDDNKRAQCDGSKGYGPTREWRHVGAIPPSLFHTWARENGVPPHFLWTREGFHEIALKMLRDPDYRWLRRDI